MTDTEIKYVRQQFDTWSDGKVYDVLIDGVKIGSVEQFWPTFERGPRNANYVTKRWRAKNPYWRVTGDGGRYATDHVTRKAAALELAARARREALGE